MDNLIAARAQMAMSLAFHIIFATIGVSLPLMMTISEWRWRLTGDPAYLLLAKRWASFCSHKVHRNYWAGMVVRVSRVLSRHYSTSEAPKAIGGTGHLHLP
jgi:cytochrome bd-type quinol oxidase subunit 1